MGSRDAHGDRPLADDALASDPAWEQVAGFLERVETAYPMPATTGVEAEHLAMIARAAAESTGSTRPEAAARSTGSGHAWSRQLRTTGRRVGFGVAAGVVVALTTGLGAAAALGVNPIAQLVSVLPSVLEGPHPHSTHLPSSTDHPAWPGTTGTAKPAPASQAASSATTTTTPAPFASASPTATAATVVPSASTSASVVTTPVPTWTSTSSPLPRVRGQASDEPSRAAGRAAAAPTAGTGRSGRSSSSNPRGHRPGASAAQGSAASGSNPRRSDGGVRSGDEGHRRG